MGTAPAQLLKQADMPPELVAEFLAVLSREYLIFLRDKEVVILSCLACGEIWSLRVPVTETGLQRAVESNGCCIRCGDRQIVRGDL